MGHPFGDSMTYSTYDSCLGDSMCDVIRDVTRDIITRLGYMMVKFTSIEGTQRGKSLPGGDTSYTVLDVGFIGRGSFGDLGGSFLCFYVSMNDSL